jgi:cyclopropane-fatty-acyl-phospholipid synthase
MWTALLDTMLNHLVKEGTLNLVLPDGTRRSYGSGTPAVTITIKDQALIRRLVLNPSLAVGEAYMDDQVEIENDDLRGFFAVILPNFNGTAPVLYQRVFDAARQALRRFRQFAPVGKAAANVQHHYDLSGELYDLFLDADRQYSCAYFEKDDATIDEAQLAKKRHVADKLMIEPGMRVLDIGCGWGGMALTLAREYGAHVVGVTLSKEQHAVATERVRAEGLEDQVEIRLCDYREVSEVFDRIVSVGMFEHVGVPHYREYFGFVKDHMTEDGIALIHTIGHVGPANEADPWIVKYIFPGGYTPALSEIMKPVDKHMLVTQDVESLRLHYAKTLGLWYDRFMARADEARALYDERFVRMWRFYLLSMEASFSVGNLLVYQLQLGKSLSAVPITRDYLYKQKAEKTGRATAHNRTKAAAE